MDEQKSEHEAQEKNFIPESVETAKVSERGEYFKLKDASKEFVTSYGSNNLEDFLSRVGSDGIFASKVVNDMLAEKFGGEKSVPTGVHPDSPQESNIVGILDHTEATPKKLAGTPAEAIPPAMA